MHADHRVVLVKVRVIRWIGSQLKRRMLRRRAADAQFDAGLGRRTMVATLGLGAPTKSASQIDIDVEEPHDIVRRLRVSLTDYCNFRCFFCHNEGQAIRRRASANMLDAADYARIARATHRAGVRYIKLTGGEPLLYRDESGKRIDAVIGAFRAAYGDDDLDISITTNGALLDQSMAERLAKAGLQRVTVSLATLDPDTFSRLIKGRSGNVRGALDAIEAANHERLKPVKVNTVLFGPGPSGPGNIDELPQIIEECRQRQVAELRLYPMLYAAGIDEFDDRYQYWDQRIIDLILKASWVGDHDYDLLLDTLQGVVAGRYDGTARRSRFTLSVPIGGVRIAMNVMPLDRSQLTCTCPAGASCQEGPYALRLSASGQLRGCLNGPVLGDLSENRSDVDTLSEIERVKRAFILAFGSH